MDFTIDRHLQSRFQAIARPDLPMPIDRPDDWPAWRNRLTRVVIDAMGGLPTAKPLVGTKVLEQVEMQGYTRLRVALDPESTLPIPCYVLVPHGEGAARPAVLALHGHGYGSREIVGLGPNGQLRPEGADPGYQQDFALSLVHKGFVVIAPDLFGFGERRLREHQELPMNQSSCHRASTFLWMLGETVLSLRVWDAMRCLDYLGQREDVDAGRIGVMGISGGGMVALFAAALDKRIRASVISGYFNTFHDSVMAVNHCVDNFLHGISTHADLPDIAALLAPRPLLIEAGKEDDIFPLGGMYAAYRRLKEGYRTLEAEDRLELDVFDGGHRISGQRSFDFLAHWLQGGA